MKKLFTKYAAWAVIVVMVVLLIPAVANRTANENKNNNIVVSALYKDFEGNLSPAKLSETMDKLKEAGVSVVSVSEDNLSTLADAGELTTLTYGSLCHKYDAESMYLAEQIGTYCNGKVSSGSRVIIAKKDKAKEKLARVLPMKFTDKDYVKVEGVDFADVYVFYDERTALWNYTVGYDEEKIKMLKDKGFEIALVYKVENYAVADYLGVIEDIIEKYDVEYLNLKKSSIGMDKAEAENDKNYKEPARIINEHDMTLVVTENTDQLSNQEFLGYSYVFNQVMGAGGSQKVMRSYETYDDSVPDETKYKYRTTQYTNSTIDRSLRFITVTMAIPDDLSYEDCADNTVKAAKEYIDGMKAQGFTVNGETKPLDYSANTRFNSAVCAVIMLMWLLLMWEMLTERKCFNITVGAIILAACAFAATFVMPKRLLGLYPTAYSVLQSCFAMTLILYFVKNKGTEFSATVAYLGALAMLAVTLLLGSFGMGAMLSGIDYYMNNSIFRGIKMSLIIPAVYTAAAFYIMYMKKRSIAEDVKAVLFADIKVYWVILVGIIGAVGLYYIIRSGNVSEISSAERTMRNTLAELFTARPRTKEFLIGYPSLMLFIYYCRNTHNNLFRGVFALGTAILASSVTNSFCHVFTNFSIIFERVVNGLLVGLGVCVVVYIANMIFVRVAKNLRDRF